MAYEKTTWKSGDIVTSEKLNNIETGIADRTALICELENGALDHTAGEIANAYLDGVSVLVHSVEDANSMYSPIITYMSAEGQGYMFMYYDSASHFLMALSLDDYPRSGG